jgi:hypothetical protein
VWKKDLKQYQTSIRKEIRKHSQDDQFVCEEKFIAKGRERTFKERWKFWVYIRLFGPILI